MSIMTSEYFADLAKVEEEIREELLEEIMAFEHDAELGYEELGYAELGYAELGYEEDWRKQMGELDQSLEESSRTIEALSEEEKKLKDSFFAMWMRENC